jgi:hypothetical protein
VNWTQQFRDLGILCLAGILLLSGCGRATQTPVVVETSTDFIEAMRAAGADVQLIAADGPTVLDIRPQGVNLAGEQLLIYSANEPLDPDQLRAEYQGILSNAYVWAGKYLLVYYAGKDGGTVLLIDGFLGDPVIGPQAAGVEPYPPAVPAAIRALAEAFGTGPGEVEVLAYEMVEWADACLGMPASDEVCAAVVTPGWRIELRAEGTIVEVHTDSLGENIRWDLK